MKRFLFAAVLFASANSFAQNPCNLICNGEFTNFSSGPSGNELNCAFNSTSQFNDCEQAYCWEATTSTEGTQGISTPDYVNSNYTQCEPIANTISPHSSPGVAGIGYSGQINPFQNNFSLEGIVQKNIVISQSGSYRLSMYVKKGVSSNNARIGMYLNPNNDGVYSFLNTTPTVQATLAPSNTGWVLISGDVNISAGTYSLILSFFQNTVTGNQNVYYAFDDVTLQPTPPSITMTTPICSASPFSISATSALSYNWTCSSLPGFPSTSNSVTVNPQLPVGTHTIILTANTPLGCTYQEIPIIVQAAPTASLSPIGPITMCSGSSTTLTATTDQPANIDWYFSTSSSLHPSQPLNCHGCTTMVANQQGYYFFIVSDPITGCATTSNAVQVIINPVPVLTLTSRPDHCLAAHDGQASVAVSSGTAPFSYVWTPQPPTGQGTSQINNLDGGQYTVTVTDANGCTATGTVNVLQLSPPPPPVITNNALNGNLCASTTVTFTITNFNNDPTWHYSVSTVPSAPITSLGNGVYSVTWPTSCNDVTFNVTVDNGSRSCTSSASSVVAACCSCVVNTTDAIMQGTPTRDDLSDLAAAYPAYTSYNASTHTWSYSNPNGVLYINGVFTINSAYASSVTFAPGTQIRMGYNAKIQVTGTGPCTVNFNETHISAGCNDMWDGVYFTGTNKTVNVIGSTTRASLFEDAINGLVSSGGAKFNTDNAIFNKNYISIQALNYTQNHNGNIRNTAFTCRSITFGTNMQAMKGTNTAQCPSAVMPVGALTPVNLLYPYATRRSYAGVYIEKVGSTVINPQTHQVGIATKITIGTGSQFSNMNVFDNMDYGVYAKNSNVSVINNQFQNLTGPGAPVKFPNKVFGIGVYGESDALVYTNQMKIGTSACNSFYDCNEGIDLNGYYDVAIKDNWFNSTISYPATLQPGFVSKVGNIAIFFKSGRYVNVDMGTNHIFNWRTGIAFFSEFLFSNTQYTRAQGLADIHDNEISPVQSGPFNNAFVGEAIHAEALSLNCPSCNQQTTYWSNLQIRNNPITDVFNGIEIQGWNTPWVVYNPVTLRYQSNNGPTVFKQAAVRGISNFEPVIYSNTLSGNTTTGNTTGKVELRGIYMTQNTFPVVQCNDMTEVGQCMVFEGDNIGSVSVNHMHRSTDGFVLINQGKVGPQGIPAQPNNGNQGVANDNTWDGPFLNSETNVDATSFAISSVFYVRTGYPTQPTNNVGPVGNAYNAASIQVIPGGPQNNTCLPVYISTGNTNTPGRQRLLEKIVQDSIPQDSTAQWQSKQQAYTLLNIDNTLMNGSTVLQQFYSNMPPTGMGKIATADQQLAQTNVSAATTTNQSIAPQLQPEQNYKAVNDIYIWMLNDSLPDSLQIQTLENIAAQCPQQGGIAVYRARTILELIYNDVRYWDDNCASSARTISPQTENTIATSQNVQLYPNPNDGNMTLSYSMGDQQQGMFIVYDLTGNVVSRIQLMPGTQQQTISLQNLASGMYFYQVVIDNSVVKADKIVISK